MINQTGFRDILRGEQPLTERTYTESEVFALFVGLANTLAPILAARDQRVAKAAVESIDLAARDQSIADAVAAFVRASPGGIQAAETTRLRSSPSQMPSWRPCVRRDHPPARPGGDVVGSQNATVRQDRGDRRAGGGRMK